MDKVDVMNAYHMLVDYCDSNGVACEGCIFKDGDCCKLSGSDPMEWNIYGDEDQEKV